jgi:hypothetical protein
MNRSKYFVWLLLSISLLLTIATFSEDVACLGKLTLHKRNGLSLREPSSLNYAKYGHLPGLDEDERADTETGIEKEDVLHRKEIWDKVKQRFKGTLQKPASLKNKFETMQTVLGQLSEKDRNALLTPDDENGGMISERRVIL